MDTTDKEKEIIRKAMSLMGKLSAQKVKRDYKAMSLKAAEARRKKQAAKQSGA